MAWVAWIALWLGIYLACVFLVGFSLGAIRQARWLRQARRAVPPENVRVVRLDGTSLPLELRYVGRVRGIDKWAATAIAPLTPGDRLAVDRVPGKCLVEFVGAVPLDMLDLWK